MNGVKNARKRLVMNFTNKPMETLLMESVEELEQQGTWAGPRPAGAFEKYLQDAVGGITVDLESA